MTKQDDSSTLVAVPLLSLVRQYFLLPTVFALLFAGLALFYALSATKLYRAEVTLMPVAEIDGGGLGALAGNLGAVASIAGLGASQDERQVEAIATINSRSFLAEFIVSHNLLPVLLADEWDEEAQRWDEEPSLNQAVERFSEKVFLFRQDSGTGICEVAIVWHDPAVAAAWAELIVDDINTLLRNRAIKDTEARIRFLEDELSKTTIVPVSTAISSLMEKQVHKRMIANVTEDYAFRVLDPAMVADTDDPYSPQPVLLVAAGLVLGLFFGIFLVIVRIARITVRTE
ncbi:MAG: hypothetical protein AAAFM81_03235 [Pseudomonadota bacterium]